MDVASTIFSWLEGASHLAAFSTLANMAESMSQISHAISEIEKALSEKSAVASTAWITAGATMIGALVGGLITMFANLLSFRLKEKAEERKWIYQNYVDGGINALIGALTEWRFTAQRESTDSATRAALIEETPVWGPVARCEELLTGPVLGVIVADFRYYLVRRETKSFVLTPELSQIHIDIISVLESLRNVILEKNLSSRNQIDEIRTGIELKSIAEDLRKLRERLYTEIDKAEKLSAK